MRLRNIGLTERGYIESVEEDVNTNRDKHYKQEGKGTVIVNYLFCLFNCK